MFSVAVHEFIEASGRDSLSAVPDINSAKDFMPLHIVVKEVPKICPCCCKCKIQRTLYTLNDILVDPCQNGLKSTDLVSFTDPLVTTVKANSDVGVDIVKHFGSDLKGNKNLITSASLGTIVKAEIQNAAKLLDEIRKTKVKMDNELIARVMRSKRLNLGMVVESACVSSKSQLTETDNWVVSGHTKAEMGVAVVSVTGAVNKNDTRKMQIPPGTALAYSFIDLAISPDGSVEILSTDGAIFDSGKAESLV